MDDYTGFSTAKFPGMESLARPEPPGPMERKGASRYGWRNALPAAEFLTFRA